MAGGRTIGVAVLGCGTVGGGVAALLLQQRKLILQRTAVDLVLRFVAEKDTSKHTIAGAPYCTDAAVAIDDPQTDIVVELIGGTGIAAEFIQRALKLGKPVVTANKSLLAAKGPELFALARENDACIGFEASCAGGIPIINALVHGLVANRIEALVGIVNGTCNFILTQMTRQGMSYAQALAEAQKAGFAEADPTLDVSGRDAAQKLAILASLAFNGRVAESDIHVRGIDSLEETDLKFAGELGYVIKLLAIAQREGKKVSLRVHPTLVHKTDMLAEVSDSFNAVSIWGNAVGHVLFYGRGAGRTPTASAVVSDIVQIAMGPALLAFKQMNMLPDESSAVPVLPFKELMSRYYLRLTAKDRPGVLAQVTRILGDHGISLSAVLQREVGQSRLVPVVITTHLAREGDVQSALKKIDRLSALKPPAVCLRIIDAPKEFAGG